jgi:hypothetical protein
MEKYVIQEASRNCPGIAYWPDSEKLELIGRSIPEDPELIFKPLDEWIDRYFEKGEKLNVYIKLEYINSGSSKYLLETLRKLAGYGESGKAVKVKWFYEEDDETIFELGEHYRDNANIPMELEKI